MSAANLLERYDRELDPAEEPGIIAYWRFEPDSTNSTYADKTGDFPLTASDGEFVRPGAPLTLPLFEVAGTGSSAVLKTNFSFVSTEGTTKGAGYSVKQARERVSMRGFPWSGSRLPVSSQLKKARTPLSPLKLLVIMTARQFASKPSSMPRLPTVACMYRLHGKLAMCF